MNRRQIIKGIAACAGLSATSSVPAVAVEFDPLVRGIRWQAWPFGTLAPSHLCDQGMCIVSGGKKPLSYFIDKYVHVASVSPHLYYEAIP